MEGVGWANLYKRGRFLHETDELAKTAADMALTEPLEVAVPLYRRPGVQNPAADLELRMMNAIDAWDGTSDRQLARMCAASAGVQSPPATPEPAPPHFIETLRELIDRATRVGSDRVTMTLAFAEAIEARLAGFEPERES